MREAFYGDESAIAALATARSISALAVVRLSGRGSLDLLARVFSRPLALKAAAGSTTVYGWIVEFDVAEKSRDKKRIDEVLIAVYRPPRSYTGEEGADICCHGGLRASRAILDELFKAGFREALPGEFSFRAFINGKLDLTRAEAVMELVSAKTEKARELSCSRLSGLLQEKINTIKLLIVEALSEIELHLDYAEEDGLSQNEALPAKDKIETAAAALKELLSRFETERIYSDGLRLAFAGLPNAGKSSLFNLFLKEERSIVSEIPGTTRDWLEAWISLSGVPLCLMDTAGLRDSQEIIEKKGIARSRSIIDEADIVVFLADGASWKEDEAKIIAEFSKIDEKKLILVWNKADIAPPPPQNFSFLPLSAKTGEGINELEMKILSKIDVLDENKTDFEQGGAGLGSERQKKLALEAASALEAALELHSRNTTLDIISASVRAAVDALGEITGEISTSDILETMFSRFCIGK